MSTSNFCESRKTLEEKMKFGVCIENEYGFDERRWVVVEPQALGIM